MANDSDLRAIFDEFDSDNSGQIDASELVGALKKVFGDEKTAKEINDLAAVSI
jgi:Ca2+-binding EF-hand superfamily protein